MKRPQTRQQYIAELQEALQQLHVSDIKDILQDYEDYFAQVVAKGYDDKESISRLPAVQELARSYAHGSDEEITSSHNAQLRTHRGLLASLIASDILLLPAWGVALALLACFGAMGMLLSVAGIVMLLPASLLGAINVPHPPLIQLLPAAALFVGAGIALMGIVLSIVERSYGFFRWSLRTRYRLATGRSKHLKFIPPVTKQVRMLLYKTTLYAGILVCLSLLLLVLISLITAGTVHFTTGWKF